MLDAREPSEHFTRRAGLPQKKSPSKTRTGDPRNIPNVPSPSSRSSGPQTPNMRQPSKPRPPLFQQQPAIQAAEPLQQPQPDHVTNKTSTNETPSLGSSKPSEHEPPVGFFTARAAETLQNGPNATVKAPLFNPHLESPSIRKTAGVDHSKTKPVNRDALGQPPPPSPSISGLPARSTFVNPQADKARKVGMPVGAGSLLQNRGSYKPPQMKRPIEGNALRDVSAASVNASDSLDAKRQKIVASGNGQGDDGALKV